MGDSDSDMKWGFLGKTGEFEKSCKEILFWLRNKENEDGKIIYLYLYINTPVRPSVRLSVRHAHFLPEKNTLLQNSLGKSKK